MKVSELLKALSEMSLDDIGLFFHSLSLGMWDEWDCDLSKGLKMFGEQEMQVALKAAVYAAQAIEKP